MAEFSRRKALLSGGALAALGALGMASPAQARAALTWTWSPQGSVAGTGAGPDPRWVWDEKSASRAVSSTCFVKPVSRPFCIERSYSPRREGEFGCELWSARRTEATLTPTFDTVLPRSDV